MAYISGLCQIHNEINLRRVRMRGFRYENRQCFAYECLKTIFCVSKVFFPYDAVIDTGAIVSTLPKKVGEDVSGAVRWINENDIEADHNTNLDAVKTWLDEIWTPGGAGPARTGIVDVQFIDWKEPRIRNSAPIIVKICKDDSWKECVIGLGGWMWDQFEIRYHAGEAVLRDTR